MNDFVYGNQIRVFINTALGCSANCQYCYLPELGYSNAPTFLSAEDVIKELESKEYFIRGRQGTIISIGCYSECWDEKNKQETLKLIKYFAKYENYIQLATKKKIAFEELLIINSFAIFENQVGIYLSIPTISQTLLLESGTDNIDNRLSPLAYINILENIYFALYIKPVIPNVTIQDIEAYRKIIENYQIPVIVGAMLVLRNDNNSEIAVGNGRLDETGSEEAQNIIYSLSPFGKVYSHSTELVNDIRNVSRGDI